VPCYNLIFFVFEGEVDQVFEQVVIVPLVDLPLLLLLCGIVVVIVSIFYRLLLLLLVLLLVCCETSSLVLLKIYRELLSYYAGTLLVQLAYERLEPLLLLLFPLEKPGKVPKGRPIVKVMRVQSVRLKL